MSSEDRSFGFAEFLLMCLGTFVGLNFCGVGIFPRQYGKNLIARQFALQGNHPRPKFVHRSWFSIFLDGQPKRLYETSIDNYVRVDV